MRSTFTCRERRNDLHADVKRERSREQTKGMDITSEHMTMFKDLVYSRCHLSFPEGKEPQLKRWLLQHVEEGDYRSFDEYFRAISSDDKKFERLVSFITTRETYFFRMPEQFVALREIVLPEIIDREGKKAMKALSRGERYRMQLRVWSAGCANGQEAYSLTMQILDTIRYAKAWDITVLGTDINRDGLALAEAGQYECRRLGKAPAQFLGRYLLPTSPKEVRVSDEVKDITAFTMLNLRNLPNMESYKNVFDIVFCRNVMIYFDLPAQQRLVSALSECLKPGGYLFTGEGEVLHLYDHDLDVVEHGESIFYRRPEEA